MSSSSSCKMAGSGGMADKLDECWSVLALAAPLGTTSSSLNSEPAGAARWASRTNSAMPFCAAARGTVAFVGRDIKSFGTLILVKHDGGVITAYAHLGEVLVAEGDIIEVGQQIATVGQTGKVDSPQLHFEIRKARKPIDPRTVIA